MIVPRGASDHKANPLLGEKSARWEQKSPLASRAGRADVRVVVFQFLAAAFQRVPRNARPILLTTLYGVCGGVAAVAFEVSIARLFTGTFLALSKQGPATFLAATFVLIVATSLAAGFLLARFCPEAAGSGIPQLKLAFWKDFGFVPARVVWVKFVAGVLTVGGGASLGREGPTVQLAGGAASQLAGALGIAKNGRRLAAAAGAAAGLAAAFNAPLASITFVLEEIVEDLNSRLLGSILYAAVLGAMTVAFLLDSRPAFDLPQIGVPTWRGYLLTPLAAAAAAGVGVVFQKGALGLREAFRRRGALGRVPAWLRPTLGGVVTWAIGAAIFLPSGHLGIFSLGYADLNSALYHELTWRLAALLLVGKLVATVAGYGTGGCGGIFAPNLFLGAMCGAALSGACQHGLAVPLSNDDHVLLTVVAMSACLGAVVRAPLTSILIVFEMTHEFALVPALLAGALVSQAISRALLPHNFYEEVLLSDGHTMRTFMPPRDLRSWRQYPVSAIANFEPVVFSPDDLAPTRLADALSAHPHYERFPVAGPADVPPGIVVRAEAEAALAAGYLATVHAAPTCQREQSVGEAQTLLIESPHGMVLLLDAPAGKVVGLLTLHDLLRAQDSLAKDEG